jgi:hypothetical protein
MDNGSSHIDHHVGEYLATRPRMRALFTPAHPSWLNQAELLLHAFSAKYFNRFDADSWQHLIDHLNESWPEYNQRFAHPFNWSWTRRHMYHWAEVQDTLICTKIYATKH